MLYARDLLSTSANYLEKENIKKLFVLTASANIPHYSTPPHPYYLLNPTIPSGTLYSSVITDLRIMLNQTEDTDHSETKLALIYIYPSIKLMKPTAPIIILAFMSHINFESCYASTVLSDNKQK